MRNDYGKRNKMMGGGMPGNPSKVRHGKAS